MATFDKRSVLPANDLIRPRREFLKKSVLIGAGAGMGVIGLVNGCSSQDTDKLSPAEDLMREHGVLNRIMLVYDSCRTRLIANELFPPDALKSAAQIIRTFIEDYHEKLEEDFLFPKFVNADQLVSQVQLLYIQHAAGNKITSQILQLANPESLKNSEEKQKLIRLLNDFNRMYRPHEAWEDTVLFPALRRIISKNEYYSLGEDFEKKEHDLFGDDGFDSIVMQVENIESQLGINDLSMFTPTMPI